MEHKTSKPIGERKLESPKKHYVTFIISLVLTALAFGAVGMGWITDPFMLVVFILALAILQAGYQLYVWMHLQEEGHRWPSIMIYSGALVAIITVVALILWSWV